MLLCVDIYFLFFHDAARLLSYRRRCRLSWLFLGIFFYMCCIRQAFPQSVRGKKTLVIGCGTSVLSEKMCDDGFRDVLSIDTSKNAVEQMTARAKPFNNANTKCRWGADVLDLVFLQGFTR